MSLRKLIGRHFSPDESCSIPLGRSDDRSTIVGHLQLERVSKKYVSAGQITLDLQHVSIEIPSGSVVTIMGASGIGKSTLLNIAAGIVHPDYGRVLLDGVPIDGPGPERLVLFQEDATLPWLTARENIIFALCTARDLARADAKYIADRFLGEVGLENFGDLYPKQLSGGAKKRVEVARSLAVDARIIIADEPFTGIDSLARFELQVRFRSLCKAGDRSVLLSTHDPEEALLMSDYIHVMTKKPNSHFLPPIHISRDRELAAIEWQASPSYQEQLSELRKLIMVASK